MSKINVGDTVRIKYDDASSAAVKAGQCGYVTAVEEDEEEGTIITASVCGTPWLFTEDDVEVLDVMDAFKAAVAEMRDLTADLNKVLDLYDAPEPDYDGVPVEEVPTIEVGVNEGGLAVFVCECGDPECEGCDEDDEIECEMEGPHYHDDDGEAHPLASIDIEDKDGDHILATDVTPLTGAKIPVAAFIRIVSPSMRRMLEVHLSKEQALALAAFLVSRYGTPRSE